MVNLTRAKEAALDIAEGIEARKTPHKSPLKSLKFFWQSRPPIAANGSGAIALRAVLPLARLAGYARTSTGPTA